MLDLLKSTAEDELYGLTLAERLPKLKHCTIIARITKEGCCIIIFLRGEKLLEPALYNSTTG